MKQNSDLAFKFLGLYTKLTVLAGISCGGEGNGVCQAVLAEIGYSHLRDGCEPQWCVV